MLAHDTSAVAVTPGAGFGGEGPGSLEDELFDTTACSGDIARETEQRCTLSMAPAVARVRTTAVLSTSCERAR